MEEKIGSFLLNGKFVDIDNISIEELEKLNKKIIDTENKKRIELNKMLSKILV